MTGGRVKRIQKYVGDEPFMLTYGDGVSDINIKHLLEFHRSHGRLATLTAVNVGQRFGVLTIEKGNKITSFREKDVEDGSRINAGYMVLEPAVFDFIEGDDTVLEFGPLTKLADIGELMAYKYDGYWQCMDTKREKEQLDNMWNSGNALWKVWGDSNG